MIIDDKVKAMSIQELVSLQDRILIQCAKNEISLETYMRADIEINKLIAQKTENRLNNS